MARNTKVRPNLITIFITTVAAGAIITGIFQLLEQALFSGVTSPGSRQWNSMIQMLRSGIAKHRPNLVPWDKEMLSLLSLNRSEERKGSWWSGKVDSGLFLSIYQEPIVAYAQMIQGRHTFFLAQTRDKEWVFRKKEKETEIWLNGQPFGVLTGGVLLASGNKNNMLAKIEQKNKDDRQFPVMLGTQTAVVLSNADLPQLTPNPRAVVLLRELQPEEESTVIALALLNALT